LHYALFHLRRAGTAFGTVNGWRKQTMKLNSLAATLTLAMLSGTADSQTPPAANPRAAAPGPSFELALEAAQTAMSTCAASGYKVAVIVIDSAGVTRVALTADGVGSGAVAFSTRKANTSLKYSEASIAVQEKVKTDTALAAAIAADPTLIARGGAQPLMSKGVLIGAIGVGGAPGGEKDDVCAVAAVAKIKGRL
jgi:uncharacterized protein GlcG (DUF336 family)